MNPEITRIPLPRALTCEEDCYYHGHYMHLSSFFIVELYYCDKVHFPRTPLNLSYFLAGRTLGQGIRTSGGPASIIEVLIRIEDLGWGSWRGHTGAFHSHGRARKTSFAFGARARPSSFDAVWVYNVCRSSRKLHHRFFDSQLQLLSSFD